MPFASVGAGNSTHVATEAFAQAGKLRALGLSTRQRSPAAADILTIAEQGYGDFDICLWFGVWAPAGTAAAVVQRIHGDILRSFDEPEVQQTSAGSASRSSAWTRPRSAGAYTTRSPGTRPSPQRRASSRSNAATFCAAPLFLPLLQQAVHRAGHRRVHAAVP